MVSADQGPRCPRRPHRPSLSTDPPRPLRTAGRPATLSGMDIVDLLRHARIQAGLTQDQLARRCGMSQPNISAYESGTRRPGFDAAGRILAGLGLQLRLSTEPLDADLDAHLASVRGLTPAQLLERVPLELSTLAILDGLPVVVTGHLAALLHGVPVPVRRCDVLLARAGLEPLAAVFRRFFASRWSERWQFFGADLLQPDESGSSRWRVAGGELGLEIVDELPPSVAVSVGERAVQVLPLLDLELDDTEAARLVQRVRTRRARELTSVS